MLRILGIVALLFAYSFLFARCEFNHTRSLSSTSATRLLSSTSTSFILPPHYRPNYSPRDFPTRRLWRTEDIQAAIHASQNPPNCSAAQYFILRAPGSGFGSQIHVITAYLAYAMNERAVLVYDASYGLWNSGDYCQGQHSFECFFMPLSSSCAPGGKIPTGAKTRYVGYQNAEVVNLFPTQWKLAFEQEASVELPNTIDRDVKYWWRAQGAAYVMRLNERTAHELARRRIAMAEEGHVPLPLPPRTFAHHVRHGDKSIEMKLEEWSKFQAAMDAVSKREGIALHDRSIFVSTEDPKVIVEAKALADRNGDVLHFVPYDRSNGPMGALQSRGADGTLHDLLNLWITLEADWFVGQLGSNWSRLLDELRRVWMGSGRNAGCCTDFIEVGCPEVLCKTDTHNW